MSERTESALSARLFDFFFVGRVPAMLLIMVCVMTGLLGYRSMTKEALPDLAIPQAVVVTEWPGASPELVEEEVTEPIERRIKGMKGLRRYRSGSLDSVSILAVEFEADAAIPESMQLLRSAVEDARPDFPKAAEGPRIEQISVRDIPVATFALSGDAPSPVIRETADKLAKRLLRLKGVKEAAVVGGSEDVVAVQLLPERMHAFGIPATLVHERLKECNHDIPEGQLEADDRVLTYKVAGAFRDVDTMKALPLARIPGGRSLRLGDVALVRRTVAEEHTRTAMSLEGASFEEAVFIYLFKTPGQDSIQVVREAMEEAEIAGQQSDWPRQVGFQVLWDETEDIWHELATIFTNGWQAMVGVFIILMVMLTWREALVAGLCIPVTFCGALGVLWAFGYTMNIMVIIGMVLALGLLVDDFILMMEGMHEAVFVHGLRFREAAIRTIKTYAVPSLSGSLTTIIVFVPLAMVGGIDGKFIRVIPVTAAVCLVLSYFVSILIAVPMSRLLLGRPAEANAGRSRMGRIDRWTTWSSDLLAQWLRTNPAANKRKALVWTLGATGLFVLSVVGALTLGTTLYPKEDGRELGITIELPPDRTLDDSAAVAALVGERLRQVDYFRNVVKIVGQRDPFSVASLSDELNVNSAPYLVGFACLFAPEEEREQMAFEYVPELREAIEGVIADVPGARLFITPDIGGATAEDPVQIDVIGETLDVLRELSAQVRRELARIPGAVDVRDNLGPPRTDVALHPRREVLDFYGIPELELAAQLRAYMENDKVGMFRRAGGDEDWEVRLGAYWPSRDGSLGGPQDASALERMHIVNPEGRRVPLRALTHAVTDAAPLVVTRKEGRRCVTVKARTDGATAAEILSALRPALDRLAERWPSGYTCVIAGEAEASQEAYGRMNTAFLLSLFLVFAILALLFNSFRQPAIIMVSVPLGLTGVFGGFLLSGIPLSFTAMVGIVSLVGITVNDAIVMIETMNGHRRDGRNAQEAAVRGAADRLRPILSTSITTIVGLTPLALAEPGWMPLCAAIIFGLLASTVISLVLIPALYLLLTPRHMGKTSAANCMQP